MDIDAAHIKPAPPESRDRRFDGVICFGGEDWWYHNRGHFDMRMMRELSEQVPVLYINSIGMRTPAVREGRMFVRRMARKLRSITRGFVRIDDRFGVVSPFVAPTGMARKVTMPTLPVQVRAAAKRMGITRPLIWICCPTAAEVADAWPDAPLVYQRTDRFERFLGVDAARVTRFDEYLKARADLTVFCSSLLLAEEATMCTQACLLGHGVDYQRFAEAGTFQPDDPEDIRALPRPRIGFVGSIDAHTFDPKLLCDVASRLPDAHFALVGGCSLPQGWCNASNVTLLGRKPYDAVHTYMAACDVLIMPWARNTWIEACNPVKLKEYLATGRPIVSTPFPELKRFGDLVHTADTAEDFADAIRAALTSGQDSEFIERRRALVRRETWTSKCDSLLHRLRALGIGPEGAQPATREPERIEDLSARPAAESIEPKPLTGPDRAVDSYISVTRLFHNRARGVSSGTGVSPVRDTVPCLAVPDAVSGIPAPRHHLKATHGRDARATADCDWRDSLERYAPARSLKFPNITDTPPPAAVIILAGGLDPTPLVSATGCSVLDLWLTPEQRVLDCWIDALRNINGLTDGTTPVRVISSATSPPPWPRPLGDIDIAYEEEPKRFRGVAGLLHDLCRPRNNPRNDPQNGAQNGAQQWSDHLLVVEAGWLAMTDIASLWNHHRCSGADVTVGCDRFGTPAGVYAVRCSCFERVPAIGYTDLKEQLLEAASLDVRAFMLSGPGVFPLRNREDFLRASARLNLFRGGRSLATLDSSASGVANTGTFTSAGRYGLVMAGRGAQISASATVIDSVIMPGCVVGEGACVVRSVLCGGTRVQPGTDIADCVAGPRGLCADPGRCVAA